MNHYVVALVFGVCFVFPRLVADREGYKSLIETEEGRSGTE